MQDITRKIINKKANHDRNGYNTKNDYEHSHGKHKPNKER